MAFQIITDPDKLCALCDAGLLWWVSKEDGGSMDGIQTYPFPKAYHGSYWESLRHDKPPCFGVLLED